MNKLDDDLTTALLAFHHVKDNKIRDFQRDLNTTIKSIKESLIESLPKKKDYELDTLNLQGGVEPYHTVKIGAYNAAIEDVTQLLNEARKG